jgi:hypothetical protein
MQNVKITSCEFKECDFSKSNMSGTTLKKVEFHGGILARFAVLDNATLTNVTSTANDNDFDFASLRKTNLRGCKLPRTGFRFADLAQADLRDGTFTDCDFSCADLRGARLSGADLSSCDFRGALLAGADFGGTVVASANFAGLPLSECAVPPPVKAKPAEDDDSHVSDDESERDGVRLPRRVAALVSQMLGAVDSKLASHPLAVCRLPDGTTFERHPHLLRVIGPAASGESEPPLELVRHVAITHCAHTPEGRDTADAWRQLTDDLLVWNAHEGGAWREQHCALSEAVLLRSAPSGDAQSPRFGTYVALAVCAVTLTRQ